MIPITPRHSRQAVAAPTTGTVLPYPSILPAPVIQCRRYGPLPKGVVSIPKLLTARTLARHLSGEVTRTVAEIDKSIAMYSGQISIFEREWRSAIAYRSAAQVERQKAVQA